jgi:hypothetical protein
LKNTPFTTPCKGGEIGKMGFLEQTQECNGKTWRRKNDSMNYFKITSLAKITIKRKILGIFPQIIIRPLKMFKVFVALSWAPLWRHGET